MNRPKILYVVEAMGGGVFTYIVDLANKLADDFDIYIAYGVRRQTPPDYTKYFDKRIHLCKVVNFQRSIGFRDVKAFHEIKRIARQVKPDLIHLHSSKAGILGRWAFSGKDIPLFYTPHGYSFLMSGSNQIKQILYRGMEAISAKRACTTISCSAGEHRETLRMTKRAICVNNGIDMAQIQMIQDRTKKINHPYTVFTLGRICEQKNPKLFNEIAEVMPDVRFLWIGDGEMRDELKASNIEVTGWTSRENAVRIACNADVFLLTSLWEGLPISLLEAMYMKKLCVVSNVSGNRDVIHNKENGYVCETLKDYVSAIRTGGTEMLQKAYMQIQEEYNTDVMADKYRRIYLNSIKSIREKLHENTS